MSMDIKNEEGFEYLETGTGPVLLILHGLFGALSNFTEVVREFGKKIPGYHSHHAHLFQKQGEAYACRFV